MDSYQLLENEMSTWSYTNLGFEWTIMMPVFWPLYVDPNLIVYIE